MKSPKRTPHQGKAERPAPNSIFFTREDLERLDEIVNFMLAFTATFDVGEIGHSVEMQGISDLMSPGYERANNFRLEITDRFKQAGGAA